MKVENYISVNPRVCHGQPCFKGTRILVYLVLELLESGTTPDEIVLDYYPVLNRQSISAALHYASELIRERDFIPYGAVSRA